MERDAENSSADIDVAALACRYLDRALEEPQRKALNDHLRRDPHARSKFVRYLIQGVELEELLLEEEATESLRVVTDVSGGLSALEDRPRQANSSMTRAKGARRAAWLPSSLRKNGRNRRTSRNRNWIEGLFSTEKGHLSSSRLCAALLAAMIFGAGLASMALFGTGGLPRSSGELAATDAGAAHQFGQPQLSLATLVNVTNCRWDRARSTADLAGGSLKPGQSLHLMEGVAEMKSELLNGGIGRFQLEGPLAMILTSQGMPNLQYGTLAAQVTGNFDRFTLDTPLGRIVIPQAASIGLCVAANDVELHVFSGEATYEPLWQMDADQAADDLKKIRAGSSLKISTGAHGTFTVFRGQADESRFVTHVSMTASRLDLSERYVAEIRNARPVAYWRFESDADEIVRNEMGDRFHCRIQGQGIRWRNYQGNRSAEFGSTPHGGYLISDDSFDHLIDDHYSVEAWMKPSHFHHGTVVALVELSPQTAMVVQPGTFMEVCGPLSGPLGSIDSAAEYPSPGGRFRFAHRNPPGHVNGISCYSRSPYRLRTWQHVVGVKDGDAMQLYVDGRLVATAVDKTPLAENLRILIGQFVLSDPQRMLSFRPYMGELDEVALYDRALTEAEILKHIELVGADPESEPPDSI